MDNKIPVITIDGPAASGKGTIAELVAQKLGFHYLDSGALYRIVAYATIKNGIDPENEALVGDLAASIKPVFKNSEIYLDEEKITEKIRMENVSQMTSRIAVLPKVREALFDLQRQSAQTPGLVADGRDMGTVVFPEATLKIFLTASAQTRAKRRFLQLQKKGVPADLAVLTKELEERDYRDAHRATSPLKAADDAHILDSSNLSIEKVLEKVLAHWSDLS